VTESGFVRVSSNPKVLPSVIAVEAARSVLKALREVGGHRFLANDVSLADADVPVIAAHRQVTDAQLLTLARRHGIRMVTFDAGIAALAARLDGRALTADHGAPFRFVSPSQYGYVSAKHLARVEVFTEGPAENFGHVHPLGKAMLRGPFFQRHPRGRVWREERHRYLPGWVLRRVYAPLRPPIRWLSARGSEERPQPPGGKW
jgi:DMSO/TMAO reductase YedYZ molybdopterin-dependent catalytic subunit